MAALTLMNVGQQRSTIEDDDQSKKLGEKGVELILENNVFEALKCFTKALAHNPKDSRHFLNRCYCYLRLSENKLALSDAERVLEKSRTDLYLFLARLRAGQALFGLKKYHQAETYLKQALAVHPNNVYAKRELLRVQIKRIVYNGYNERDAILALKMHPTTLEAISYLSTNNTRPLGSNGPQVDDDLNVAYHDLSDVYYSSDEDDDPSDFEFLNDMSNYQPGKIHFAHLLPIISSDVKYKTLVNIYSIWVGKLNSTITEDVLQAAFNQLGNVTKVYKPPNADYAFVNFDNCEDVKNILKISSYLIDGKKVPVQPAYKKF
ncbi:hypothetical protein TSAR_002842 [Trichomalopsis sarcophagae]|uniref:RRM domain-containing protein n=1 Tax=Trichomalopsis sarcophagae TaxID=543379 RepID=A0A232EVR8_9HYME|nr:hypothetical protein TSAR_002842 [Trichomalopsis sarcophagae]